MRSRPPFGQQAIRFLLFLELRLANFQVFPGRVRLVGFILEFVGQPHKRLKPSSALFLL